MIKEQEVSLEDALNIALGHMQQDNFRVAELIFQDILKTHPDHAQSHYMLGLAKYCTGDVNAAITHVEDALKSDEAEAEWYCNYGIMLNELQRYDDAVKAYDKAIETDPEYPNSYWNMAHAHWLNGDYEKAEASARKGTEMDPNTAEAWLNLGTAQIKLDKRDEALESWEKALAINPDFVPALNNMGNILRETGKLDEAIKKCRRCS